MIENWANAYYKNVNEAWENIYEGLSRDGEISSPRGKRIKETLGCNIYILNPNDNLVFSKFRGLSPIYMAREYLWYKDGSRDPQESPSPTRWQAIANDDGLINSNYGHWLYCRRDSKYTDMSVWDATVKLLKEDPDTRHAIIQIPIMDYRAFKDTPCTSHIHFFLRHGKLFASVYMRSCDAVCGFTYDLFQFTMWQLEMAKELGVGVGWLRFMAGSLHVYEEDWIENRGGYDEFNKCKDEVVVLDNEYHLGSKFQLELHMLADCGAKLNPELLKTEELRYMFENRKVWSREAW